MSKSACRGEAGSAQSSVLQVQTAGGIGKVLQLLTFSARALGAAASAPFKAGVPAVRVPCPMLASFIPSIYTLFLHVELARTQFANMQMAEIGGSCLLANLHKLSAQDEKYLALHHCRHTLQCGSGRLHIASCLEAVSLKGSGFCWSP